MLLLIDERAAAVWFPNQDPIGQQLRGFPKPDEPPQWATVIGVVPQCRLCAPRNEAPLPMVYTCAYQQPSRSCP